MICRILLLISLTSCVCGTLLMNVTYTIYQAEENDDITLELMFTTKPDTSSTSLNISCKLYIDDKSLTLYDVVKGVESPESQDEQFAGRVQCDKDALREGRFRLHVSRLSNNDTGLYHCGVKTDDGESFGSYVLFLTAAPDQPEPESKGWIGLYVGLTVAAVLAVCAGLYFAFRLRSKRNDRNNVVLH